MKTSWIHRAVAVLIGIVLVTTCGCAVGKPLSLDSDSGLTRLREMRPQGLGYYVAVAPIQMYQPNSMKGNKAWPLTVKSDDLQKEIASVLEEVPVFAHITLASSANRGQAEEQGVDLLLEIVLSDCTTSFGGTNGYFIPNMLVWGILSPIASSFVADEFFMVNGSFVARLTDVASGKPVWSRSIALQERYDLNDWQRGPSIWDFFFIAPFYNTWTPAKVDAVVLPHVVQKIRIELAKGILTDLPPPKRRFALVVGLNSCSLDGAPVLRYAENDASAFAELLSGTGFEEVTLLHGEKASKEAILSALRQIAARTDVEVEDLVVFFSGLGTTTHDRNSTACRQSLLTYGTNIKECELPVDELLKAVQAVTTTNKTVIIDAGFSGGNGKTYSPEKTAPGIAMNYSQEISESSDVSFLFSCAANESSHEFDQLRHGVFTHYLLQNGMTGKADLNLDGVITVQESFKSFAWLVTRHIRTNLQGATQNPCIMGKNTGTTRILKPE